MMRRETMERHEHDPDRPPPHELGSPYIGLYLGQADALEAERQRLLDWRHKLSGGRKRFPLRLAVLVLMAVAAGLYLIGSLV